MSVMEAAAIPTDHLTPHLLSQRPVLWLDPPAVPSIAVADHRVAEATVVPLPRRAPVDSTDW